MNPESAAEAVVTAATDGQSFELWIARTWIFLPALMVLLITGAAAAIIHNYIRIWKRDGFNDVSSNVWIAAMVATVLNMMLFALMDVGQALVFFSESWGGVVGVCSTVLMPLLAYKSIAKLSTTPTGMTVESTTETSSTSNSTRTGAPPQSPGQ